MLISLIRAVILYLALILVVRLMGKRQLGELELPELAVRLSAAGYTRCEQVEGVGQTAAVLLRLRSSQRYSALRLLPATVRLHTFTATVAATQRTRQTTRVCRTATLQCV